MADRQDFDTYVVYRFDRLLRTAYLLTRNWASAEDLLQITLVKAWRVWPRLHDEPDAYVRRVMVNMYRSWWRRRRFREVPIEELAEQPGYPDGAGGVDDQTSLWAALGRLPRRERAVLVLRYFEDLTEAETARVLGCSVGTVKSQASRALAKLRIDPAMVALAGQPRDLPVTRTSPRS